ncbi:MAG: LPS export ABC transporter permease LptG [Dongiaceae bacterium]
MRSGGRRLSATLCLYLGRRFLMWFALVLACVSGIVVLAESIELLRRGAERGLGLGRLFGMALLKTPGTVQEVMPFTLLIAVMLTYWHLNRTSELMVARASGISVWQFLLPAALLAVLIGVLRITVLDPFTTALSARFQQLADLYIDDTGGVITASSNGLWLRQFDRNGQAIIHAARLSLEDQTFHSVSIMSFAPDDTLTRRVDAAAATLGGGYWHLPQAWVVVPNRGAALNPDYRLPTHLSLDQVVGSLAPPTTVSFWRLPRYIELLDATGLSSVFHRLQWQRLLSMPLLFAAMILVGAAFSLRPQRLGGTMARVGAGVTTGFLLYFISDLIIRLGRNDSIPPVLAGWTPAGMTALVGITFLLYLEDG